MYSYSHAIGANNEKTNALFEDMMGQTYSNFTDITQRRFMMLEGTIDTTGLGAATTSTGNSVKDNDPKVVKVALTDALKEVAELKQKLERSEMLLKCAKGRIFQLDGGFDSEESFDSVLDDLKILEPM